MEIKTRQIILFFFILVVSGIESIERYLEMDTITFWSIGALLLVICLISYRLKRNLLPTFSFFALLHFSKPINKAFTELIGANFNGTFFLIPVLLSGLLIALFPQIRATIGWWKKENIGLQLALQMVLAVVIGSIAMYIYLMLNTDNIDRFIGMLPEGSVLFIVGMGVAYAALNAMVEEFIVRGMIWNALEKVMTSQRLVIFTQAVLFGISHYWGLPGGLSGVVMVFLWSLYLGYVRNKTGGLVGVILLHFGANLLQYFILLTFRND